MTQMGHLRQEAECWAAAESYWAFAKVQEYRLKEEKRANHQAVSSDQIKAAEALVAEHLAEIKVAEDKFKDALKKFKHPKDKYLPLNSRNDVLVYYYASMEVKSDQTFFCGFRTGLTAIASMGVIDEFERRFPMTYFSDKLYRIEANSIREATETEKRKYNFVMPVAARNSTRGPIGIGNINCSNDPTSLHDRGGPIGASRSAGRAAHSFGSTRSGVGPNDSARQGGSAGTSAALARAASHVSPRGGTHAVRASRRGAASGAEASPIAGVGPNLGGSAGPLARAASHVSPRGGTHAVRASRRGAASGAEASPIAGVGPNLGGSAGPNVVQPTSERSGNRSKTLAHTTTGSTAIDTPATHTPPSTELTL